ncbi:protein-export chaperone SecB [Paraburkholderia sp. NPDC080076]|uniref:protein-export chaperone SecB n=1 Tax=Paraburkholderia sp. NPDC080076 TaxID=3390605 RepID=UPI003D006498
MQRSPLDLQHYHFNKLEIQATGDGGRPQPSSGVGPYPSFDGVDFSANVQVSAPSEQSSPFRFALKLGLTCKPKKAKTPFPYSFEVEAEGFFEATADDEKKAHKLAVINGSAVLYGAIREQLLTLTGRFPQGPMMLPTVNFLNLFPAQERATAAAAVAAPQTPKKSRKKTTEA